MGTRSAQVHWHGALLDGRGSIGLASSGLGPFETSLTARASDAPAATGPEELLAAAYASCYAMQLAALLEQAGATPAEITARATVTQGGPEVDFGITAIDLVVGLVVPDLAAERAEQIAQDAAHRCPVGRALAGVPRMVEVTTG